MCNCFQGYFASLMIYLPVCGQLNGLLVFNPSCSQVFLGLLFPLGWVVLFGAGNCCHRC